MRRHATLLTLILALGIGTVVAIPAAPATDQHKIAELIGQLGSQNFRQRDAATKELDAIGDAALDALRKAAKNPDMEIANRATALVAKIEARNANAKLLVPTYVELSLKEVSVENAIGELAKKSGYKIEIGGDKSKLADRKVTLETGKVPFWKALEMLCEKADLNESDLAATNPTGAVTRPNQPAPPVQVKGVATTTVMRRPPVENTTIVLVDGKAKPTPAFVDGAVRVRSLHNSDLQAKSGPVPEGEIGLLLEVKAEPKIQVQQVLGVKIDKALDNYDQGLGQSMVATNDPQGNGAQPLPIGGPRPIVASSLRRLPGNAAPQSTVPVRLKKGEKETKSIKELRGVVSLKIRTPVENIITVDNILKAKGDSAKGKADATLKILDVSTEKNGDIKLEVEMQISNEIQPSNGSGASGAIQIKGQIQGNIQIQIAPAAPNAPAPVPPQGPAAAPAVVANFLGLELIDAKGMPLKLVQMVQTRAQFQQTGRTVVATIAFHPEKDQEAAKLVLKGSWLAAVDVPFVLKDIPVK